VIFLFEMVQGLRVALIRDIIIIEFIYFRVFDAYSIKTVTHVVAEHERSPGVTRARQDGKIVASYMWLKEARDRVSEFLLESRSPICFSEHVFSTPPHYSLPTGQSWANHRNFGHRLVLHRADWRATRRFPSNDQYDRCSIQPNIDLENSILGLIGSRLSLLKQIYNWIDFVIIRLRKNTLVRGLGAFRLETKSESIFSLVSLFSQFV